MELWHARAIGLTGVDVVGVLVPTIVSLLGLTQPYASLCIPISVIISRIGLRSLCDNIEHADENSQLLATRIALHSKNLQFLEQQAAQYSSTRTPRALAESLAREKVRLREVTEKASVRPVAEASAMPANMYDVALSFAGEDREYVEAVAEYLVGAGVTVFYDRYEEVSLWGKDLAEYLETVYPRWSPQIRPMVVTPKPANENAIRTSHILTSPQPFRQGVA
jgi:hypothetical protein